MAFASNWAVREHSRGLDAAFEDGLGSLIFVRMVHLLPHLPQVKYPPLKQK